ncbi:DNA-binding protein [Campylobacter jejuni]|nr:DNA-binding protein [Campylobacter jejuni]EDO7442548.1 DNA-binding protein [Campylobacter jejuni]
MQDTNKDFLTIQEVITLYSLSKDTQNKYRMQKKIPYIKIYKTALQIKVI